MKGWILLHKKIWDNPRFYKNFRAVVVWLWLLTHCNDEGVVTCGRHQIAKDCGISDSTVYRLLKNFSKDYLGNDPILNIKPNNRFSVVYILKWKELQRKLNSDLNNHRTTTEQPTNTNKEERIKNKFNTGEKNLNPNFEYEVKDGSDYNPKSILTINGHSQKT